MMANALRNPKWGYRFLLLFLCALILFLNLLPINTAPSVWSAPDLIACLIFAWTLRRPSYAPTILVALIAFSADMILQRPPGLYAAGFLIANEFLRSRAADIGTGSFTIEWAYVALALIAALIFKRLLLHITLADNNSLSLTLTQLLITLLAYPVVAAFCHFALKLRFQSPSDIRVKGANP
jgi:rod shape-determining protein MreD